MTHAYDAFLVLFSDRGVIFQPRKNLYLIVNGEILAAMRNEAERAGIRSINMLAVLKGVDPRFAGVNKIHTRMARIGKSRAPSTADFQARFNAYCSGLASVENRVDFGLTALAFAGVVVSNLLIRIGRFDVVVRGTLVRDNARRLGDEPVLMGRIGRAIARARQFLPGRFDCVSVAFAYKTILFAHGYPCAIQIGVLDQPFTAHMWATSSGVVLGDQPEVIEDFELLFSSSW
jgi:hypothetical protein